MQAAPTRPSATTPPRVRSPGRRQARRRLLVALSALSLTLGLATPAFGDSVTELAKRLAALRGEVESLSSDLSQKEADMRDQLRSLARQKAELELELKKEQTRLRKAQLSINQKKQTIEAEKKADQALVPVFKDAVAQVRKYVDGSLPFRKAERQAAVTKIEEQYKSGLLTPQRALSRLWSFVEDELRLTRETGMYRQTITLEDRDQLADVVRVGTVMLYFMTSDGTAGHARRADDGWEYVEVTEPKRKRRIEGLFEAMQKQIRVGYFELPNALPNGGAK